VNERELRAYLLGQAPEADAVRLEERLLEDDELFQVLESIEDDLFDAHARGQLTPAERDQFEARYGKYGERQRFARALAMRVSRGQVEPFRRRAARAYLAWAPLAAAAALILAVAVVMLVRQRPARQPTVLTTKDQSPAVRDVMATLLVILDTSRAAGAPTPVTFSKDASKIELRVQLHPGDRFERYSMELRAPATDAVLWRADSLRATDDNGNLIVTGIVPAASMPDGLAELAVRGLRGGATEDLGFVTMKVVRGT
jgi:anti-sigma-K factor RskA